MGKKIVIVNNEVLVDHTQTTVKPEDVRAGKKFYNQAGDIVEGRLPEESLSITPDFDSEGKYKVPLSHDAIYKNIDVNKPSDYMKVPCDELNITTNGEYDVINYAKVDVKIPDPQLQTKTATKNKQLIEPDSDKDGLSAVFVDLGDFQKKIITENGNYIPDEGYSAFSEITVATKEYNLIDNVEITPDWNEVVRTPGVGFDGFKKVTVKPMHVETEERTVTSNGEITPSAPNKFISKVTVDVQPRLDKELTINRNGTYRPKAGTVGFPEVTVDVPDKPLEECIITPAEVTQEITPSSGIYGISKVVVNPIQTEGLDTITENGTYSATEGSYFKEVNVDVQPVLEPLEVTENGTYLPCNHIQGFDKVVVQVVPEVVKLQENKEVTPSSSSQLITHDVGFDALKSVIVNPVPTTTLTVTSNGEYVANRDEFWGAVHVNVPEILLDVEVNKSVTFDPFSTTPLSNTFTINPSTGKDAMYSATVNLDIDDSRFKALEITDITDAVYVPSAAKREVAYTKVTVDLPIQESIEITDNGKAVLDSGMKAVKDITVNVPIKPDLTITENGTYTASNYASKGIAEVIVDIPEASDFIFTPDRSGKTVEYPTDTIIKKIQVNPIPAEYIVPSGTLDITSDSSDIDVKAFKYVNVQVMNLQPKVEIQPSQVEQKIEIDTANGYNGLSEVVVKPILAKDLNITPSDSEQIFEIALNDDNLYEYWDRVIVAPAPIAPEIISGQAIEINTAAEMDALLDSATAVAGTIYKYIGDTTAEYEHGEIYILNETKI